LNANRFTRDRHQWCAAQGLKKPGGGARGPSRTGTILRSVDFESTASTNSATRANQLRGAQYREVVCRCKGLFESVIAACYRARPMQLSDFQYHLPPELIAQHPLPNRSASRLLHVAGNALHDRSFNDIPSLLRPNDLLVFNNTRVIPARVFGVKPTGGRVEIMLERILDGRRILAQVGSSKPLRTDTPVQLAAGVTATFVARHDDMSELELSVDPLPFFIAHGALPLPPYIERSAEAEDTERYQTVFSRELGAVAAPTAGLHFDEALLTRIANMGVRSSFLTLHVGAGTFQPVRVQNLDEHRMHEEVVQVSQEVCDAVAETRRRKGRVIAVGTTVVRSLETAAQTGELQPCQTETRLFIRPGYSFKVIDALITNFHLPESTLLMLVAALGGYETIMAAYRHAVAQRYRFFSYGDAMFVEPAEFS
jgi:S-adenosylmethionine:tRNA ribosyltransferase-isomerase